MDQASQHLRRPSALIALCAGLLALGACDKTPPKPPKPVVDMPAPTAPGAGAGATADPSVPPAASVLMPANTAKVDPPLGRANSAMSAAQQSTAMPMPGQNNDHSAPLSPAKRASAP